MEIFDCQGSNDILKDLIGAKRVFRWLSACYFRVLHHELANRSEALMDVVIGLGVQAANQLDAIRQAGDMLVKAGCVAPEYVDGMLARERVMLTYLGSSIAMPNGELANLRLVYRTGVSILQYE